MRRRSQPVRLDVASTAVAVLDLGRRCTEPHEVCRLLIPGVGAFLETARAAGVAIVFTNGRKLQSTPDGAIAPGLGRRANEPVLFPDHYDKFHGGELFEFLRGRGSRSIVLCGSSTNVCILYTATTAVRQHGLEVVIPLDGVNARTTYRHGYALHQLASLPGPPPVRFTKLRQVTWVRSPVTGIGAVEP